MKFICFIDTCPVNVGFSMHNTKTERLISKKKRNSFGPIKSNTNSSESTQLSLPPIKSNTKFFGNIHQALHAECEINIFFHFSNY